MWGHNLLDPLWVLNNFSIFFITAALRTDKCGAKNIRVAALIRVIKITAGLKSDK